MFGFVGKGCIFIVDTEDYAGDFEREMCGYLTGIVGECGVGVEGRRKYLEDMGLELDQERYYAPVVGNPFEEIIKQVPDEHGCRRPASIYLTPGWYNDGHGGHYDENVTSDAEVLKEYVEAVERECEEEIKHLTLIATEEDTPENRKRGAWTAEAKTMEIKRYQEEITTARQKVKVNRYPAYLSVAIFFDEKPTEEQIELMKERAYDFAKDTNAYNRFSREDTNPIKITGFRLLEVTPESYEEI